MNCKQCGAPLKVEGDQDFFHCDYCDSYNFPDPNLDGVALLEEVSPYICPACNQPLVTSVVMTIRILSCPKCRGNLISQAKMFPILRQAQVRQPVTPASGEELRAPQQRSEYSRQLTCPSCRKTMQVYPYAGPGNIIIQGCAGCQLIWLDFGELSRIMRAFLEAQNHPANRVEDKHSWSDY
jgi:Zn-finger nucleic acid-binding protein